MAQKKLRKSSYVLTEEQVFHLPSLHRAVWKRKWSNILAILCNKENHCKVTKRDIFNRTTLHYAASRGDTQVLQFLLSINTQGVHALDNDGRSPFYKACQALSLDCMKILIEKGSDIHCVDYKECSIIEKLIIESGDGCLECLEFLITNQGERFSHCCDTLMLLAVKYGRIGVVNVFIKHGCNANAFDKKTGRTALMQAVCSEFCNITEVLLRANANVEATDYEGKTARDYATDNSRILELLNEFDCSRDMLDTPSKNKVFVTFHRRAITKNNNPGNMQALETKKVELLHQIAEINKEISKCKECISENQRKNRELKQKIIAFQNHERVSKQQNEAISPNEKQPTKVLLKKLLMKGYQSREAWSKEFNELVASYDELKHEYENQLVIESNLEYELEKCNEILHNEKKNIFSREEQNKIKVDEIANNFTEDLKKLKLGINQMKENISQEKARFKNVIDVANRRKLDLHKEIETVNKLKETKMNEFKTLEEQEEQLNKDIEKCNRILQAQSRLQNRLMTKIDSVTGADSTINRENCSSIVN